MTLLNQQFLLAQRPVGAPTRETFEFVEKPLGEPGPNQILVKVEYLSIDPAMRGWMNDAKSYIPPVGIGEVMWRFPGYDGLNTAPYGFLALNAVVIADCGEL